MTDVRPFVEDVAWGEAALATVLAAAEAGDGTVRWADVSDDLDSTEWGALVERGLLVDAGDAFVIDDPVAVAEVVDAAVVEAAVAGAGVTDAGEVDDTEEIGGAEDPDGAGADDDEATETTDDAPDDGGAAATAPDADATDGGDGGDAPAAEDASGWSTIDRAAGVGALALMTGYQVAGIRNAVGASLDVFLGPVEAVLPFPAVVLLLAAVTAVASTLLRRRLAGDDPGTERVKELREEVAAARERGDEEAVQRLVDEQTDLMLSTFKTQIRPVAWTMLVTIPVFLWLYWVTLSPNQAVAPVVTVLPYLGDVVWTARVVGPMRAWMLWYALCSLSTGVAFRRAVARLADG